MRRKPGVTETPDQFRKSVQDTARAMATAVQVAVDDLSETRGRTSYAQEASENPKDLAGSKKPPLSLIPPSAEVLVSLALAHGADKYGPYNWRGEKIGVMAYLSADKRHAAAFLDGEDNDREGDQLPHLAHRIATLMILLDAMVTGHAIDDRPAKGVAADLLAKYTRK